MTLAVIPLLINGKEVSTDTTFDVVNPSSGETVFKANGANAKLAKEAVDAAQKAFPAWSRTKPNERRALFFKAVQLLEQRQDEVTKIQMEETSMDKSLAGGFLSALSIGMLRECGSRTSSIEGSIPEPDEEGILHFECVDIGSMALVVKEPYGVVVGMVPWNAPLFLGFRAVCAPIACGNTVVYVAILY
jgi:acyl-CoA reductase-like NAD-dependent aldehyde dehydrogenase